MLHRSFSMLILCFCGIASFATLTPPCQSQARPSGSSTQQKLAALKQARDSGVLTEDEYQQKVAALTGGGAHPAASSPRGASTASGDAHTWKLKREEQSAPLTDWRSGQTRTFKMVSMLVPEGWTMQPQPGPTFGKIDCNDNSSRFVLSAKSSDGSIGILALPASATLWSTNQSVLQQKRQFNQQWKVSVCDLKQPESLSAYMQANIPKIMPGTQSIGGIQPIPELSAQLPQIVAGSNQQLASQGAHMSAEAGRQRITYSANGRQYEAWVVAMKTERTTPAPGGGQIIITDYPLLAMEFAPARATRAQRQAAQAPYLPPCRSTRSGLTRARATLPQCHFEDQRGPAGSRAHPRQHGAGQRPRRATAAAGHSQWHCSSIAAR